MIYVDDLVSIIGIARKINKSIVMTNGVFDLLHAGHVRYLEAARKCGDLLFVGVNSNNSAKMLKGDGRPVTSEDDRVYLVSMLKPVDYAFLFHEKTFLPTLQRFKPDVHVKGGDYTLDTINQEERRFVEGYGGEIKILSGVTGISTTEIIQKIHALDI